MASYGSYKKVVADQFQSGAVTTAKLANSAGMCSGLLWIYNERALACVNCANAGGCV
jgi:hypothetical protein